MQDGSIVGEEILEQFQGGNTEITVEEVMPISA
jgi:hypothetical protein